MSSKRFVIADVFTEKRFGGNQLAVFTDGSGLGSDTMQDIAREMNFSETTFLLPAKRGGDYRVRIFTPLTELPFAGHPVVGTAYVIVAERMKQPSEPATPVTLEVGVGPIHADVENEGGRPGRTTMTQPLPVLRGAYAHPEKVAKALSLDANHIERFPIETIYNGIAVMIVPVTSRVAVERIRLNAGDLAEISDEVGAQTVLVFSRETLSPAATAHCRVVAPAAGVAEDPATGSANGPLGFYLVRHKLVPVAATTKIVTEQGFEMKRPSILHIEVDADTATGEVAGVRVGGDVVIAGRGEILIDL